jgi:hypothetical protein
MDDEVRILELSASDMPLGPVIIGGHVINEPLRFLRFLQYRVRWRQAGKGGDDPALAADVHSLISMVDETREVTGGLTPGANSHGIADSQRNVALVGVTVAVET